MSQASTFKELLLRLEHVHDCEIQQLHAELEELRAQCATQRPTEHQPQRLDEHLEVEVPHERSMKKEHRGLLPEQQQKRQQDHHQGQYLDQHEQQKQALQTEQESAVDDAEARDSCIHNRWIVPRTCSTASGIAAKPVEIQSTDGIFDIDAYAPGEELLSWRRCFANNGVLDPLGYRRLTWDLLSVAALCGDAIWIPMAAFDPADTVGSTAYAWTITIYWALDIYMSFNTGYYSKRGQRVMSRRLIAVRYLKSWMIPDAITVGIDMAIMVMSASAAGQAIGFARAGKMARIVRAVRALRLLRLVKLRRIMFFIQDIVDNEYISIILNLMKNMFGLLAVNHAIACAWFALGNAGHPGWVSVYGFKNSTLHAKYMVSLHWSLAQFTPAPMNIQPQTSGERAFALIILVFGLLVFSSFVASNTAALTQIRALSRSDMRQHFLLRKYLAENHISRELSMRVMRYTELVRAIRHKKAHPSKVEYLALLSGPLSVRLQAELVYPHMSSHPFFLQYKTCDPEAMNHICAKAAKHQSFSKDDMVITVNSKAEHMLFVTQGLLVYFGVPESKLTMKIQLVPGWWMCEGVLWVKSWVHQGSACADAETDVIALDEAKFYQITSGHPDVYRLACDYAQKFVANSDQEQDELGYFSDLPREKVEEFHQSQEATMNDTLAREVLAHH